MIKHIVMFKFKASASEAKKQEIKSQLDALPGKISQIKSFETGVNISKSKNAFDLILVSEFDSLKTLEEYRVHEDHQKLIASLKPIKEKTNVVDYEI